MVRESVATGFGMVVLASACAATAPSVTPTATTKAVASASATPSASAPPSTPTPMPPPTGGSVTVGEILAPPHFDPTPTLETAKPQLLDCYNQARQAHPALRGKLMLRININEAGSVLLVDAAPGGAADDPFLVTCLGSALKAMKFPKPAGLAIVSAPLVFRP